MTWLGVGNVEGRVLSGDPSARRPKGSLALGSGVPGHELPAVRAATLERAAGRRPRPGHRRDRCRLRGLARHLRLDPGDQRAHPGRPLEALGRRPGGGGPLPRARGRERRRGSGAGRSERPTRPRSATICATRPRPRSGRVRARARGGEPAAQRARPGRRPPGGLAVGARRRRRRRGGAASSTRAAGDFFLEGLVHVRDGPARLRGGPRRPPGSNGARPSCRASCRPSSPTPRSPSTPRLARGDAAAGGRAGARARGSRLLRGHGGGSRATPDRRSRLLPGGRHGAGRRSSDGSTCPRSTGSSA